jgi:hypothetical protein
LQIKLISHRDCHVVTFNKHEFLITFSILEAELIISMEYDVRGKWFGRQWPLGDLIL